jgi:hypothetical protein
MGDVTERQQAASLTEPEYAVVRRQLGNVLNNVQSGYRSISGQTYGALIRKGSPPRCPSSCPHIYNVPHCARN